MIEAWKNMKTSLVIIIAGLLVGAGVSAAEPVRVLILTGQNNHNWKVSTPEFKATLEAAGRFTVEVNETPWNLKPADLDRYDVLVSNWNTYGKKEVAVDEPAAAAKLKAIPSKPADPKAKPPPTPVSVWGKEMRAAFDKFITNGKGFVVIHAGGDIYKDWPEFQRLIGATWGKGTYHPKPQNFTVKNLAPDHPIMRGIADFEIMDEAWQRMVVNNPEMKILAKGTVSKENKGTGEPEPYVIVVEQGKGRCFNLVLGHTAEAHHNPNFAALLCHGVEWAATGQVTLPALVVHTEVPLSKSSN